MTTLTHNGQKVNEIITSENMRLHGHTTTMLYSGKTVSRVLIKGNSKDDCLGTLRATYPNTASDFRPTIEWYYSI